MGLSGGSGDALAQKVTIIAQRRIMSGRYRRFPRNTTITAPRTPPMIPPMMARLIRVARSTTNTTPGELLLTRWKIKTVPLPLRVHRMNS
jgi:hypothetical protein